MKGKANTQKVKAFFKKNIYYIVMVVCILAIAADTDYLDKVARQGAEKARASAAKTLNEVRRMIGFHSY